MNSCAAKNEIHRVHTYVCTYIDTVVVGELTPVQSTTWSLGPTFKPNLKRRAGRYPCCRYIFHEIGVQTSRYLLHFRKTCLNLAHRTRDLKVAGSTDFLCQQSMSGYTSDGMEVDFQESLGWMLHGYMYMLQSWVEQKTLKREGLSTSLDTVSHHLNPGDGVYNYKAENFVFSPVSFLRSWRSHLFVWMYGDYATRSTWLRLA